MFSIEKFNSRSGSVIIIHLGVLVVTFSVGRVRKWKNV
jgi:hypothetical protein